MLESDLANAEIAAQSTPRTTPFGRAERLELERQILFDGVAFDHIMDLMAACTVRHVEPGEVLIAEGDARSECYLILSGMLRIHLGTPDSKSISRLQAGESVGEIALLDGKPASAFVLADQPSRLLVLPEEVFWTLVNSSHDFAQNLLFLLARRMRGSNDTISDSILRQRKIQQSAIIDQLSGLHNRRWMQEVLAPQIGLIQRKDGPLSLLMIDIDHFKKINDTYGHLAGDQVIQMVARTLVDKVRPTDLLARFGGEEFVAILPRTDLAAAWHIADRTCSAMREVQMVDRTDRKLPRVTVSIGVAQMLEAESFESLVDRADQAMYRAKNTGRDRVEA